MSGATSPNAQAADGTVAGTVVAFPIERLGRFGAAQVLTVNVHGSTAVVGVLDWLGEAEPGLNDVRDAGRMMQDSWSWGGDEMVSHVELPFPSGFRVLGELPVIADVESRAYGSWATLVKQIIIEASWDELPDDLTSAYRAAQYSERTVTTPGLVYERTGEPVVTREQVTSFQDGGGHRLTEDFRLEALRAWPRLDAVHLRTWRDDLLPFLASSPLITELTLACTVPQNLDLSGSSLRQLSIDVTGMQRLVLPASMNTLILHGATTEPLYVDAEQCGRWMTLQLPDGAAIHLAGLEDLGTLRVHNIRDLSIADIVQQHPHLRTLLLFGAPGLLHDVHGLASLPHLEGLSIIDLFGYSPTDFPTPVALAALERLDLDSIPADVATWARGVFRNTGVDLEVRKPRKPEWLAENLENPLRGWDGRAGIPTAAAKKARTAFVTALREVRTVHAAHAAGGVDADAFTTQVTGAITSFLEVIHALNAKRRFLDTLEIDEVIDAVNVLDTGLPAPARAGIDPLIEALAD